MNIYETCNVILNKNIMDHKHKIKYLILFLNNEINILNNYKYINLINSKKTNSNLKIPNYIFQNIFINLENKKIWKNFINKLNNELFVYIFKISKSFKYMYSNKSEISLSYKFRILINYQIKYEFEKILIIHLNRNVFLNFFLIKNKNNLIKDDIFLENILKNFRAKIIDIC